MTIVLTGKTQFESLPQEWQNQLISLQEKMVAEERICEEISHITDQPIVEISQRIESVTEKFDWLQERLNFEIKKSNDLNIKFRKQLKESEEQLNLIRRVTSSRGAFQTSFQAQYFYNLLLDFEQRMQQLRVKIEEIESVIVSNHQPVSSASIGEIIQNNTDIFIALASDVSELHDKFQQAKSQIVSFLRKDPFEANQNLNSNERQKNPILVLPPPTPAPQQQAQPQNTTLGGFGTPLFSGSTGGGATSFFGNTSGSGTGFSFNQNTPTQTPTSTASPFSFNATSTSNQPPATPTFSFNAGTTFGNTGTTTGLFGQTGSMTSSNSTSNLRRSL